MVKWSFARRLSKPITKFFSRCLKSSGWRAKRLTFWLNRLGCPNLCLLSEVPKSFYITFIAVFPAILLIVFSDPQPPRGGSPFRCFGVCPGQSQASVPGRLESSSLAFVCLPETEGCTPSRTDPQRHLASRLIHRYTHAIYYNSIILISKCHPVCKTIHDFQE